MHPLFHDLLFPCVTGSLELSSKPALKIFICSNIRLTCWSLHQKVNEICNEVFKNIYPELADVSKSFIYRWILGKPIIKKLEEYPPLDFSLKLLAEKISSPTPVYCTSMTSPALFVLHESELCLVDLKNAFRVSEDAIPISKISPIFYNDQLLVAFNNQWKHELHCHPSKIIHELPPILSMQRLDDFIVFECVNGVAACSIEDFTTSDKPAIHKLEELQEARYLKAFSGKLLFFNKQIPAFYMLYVEDMKLKMNESPVTGPDLSMLSFKHHAFHEQSKYIFFLFQKKFEYARIGAISPGELTHLEPQPFIFYDEPISIGGILVPYKDTVLRCNDVDDQLQIERIDVVNGIIRVEPLSIKGAKIPHLWSIVRGFSHLDKVFIIANSRVCSLLLSQHLIIIDMTTHTVESTKELGYAPNYGIDFIPSPLGKLFVTFPTSTDKNRIFNVDYT